MTKPVISKEPEVSWRTEMVKSALQLHGRPSEEAVKSCHKHLLAEFETLAGAQVAKKGGSSNLALKAADASGDKGGKASGAKGGGKGGGNGATCKYFLSPKGCKFGSKCKYPHSMNELSKAERFKKCLNCGSEEHRAKDCKAGKAEPKTQDQKPSVQAVSSSGQSVVHATPVLNMETFMQQAGPGFEAVGGQSTAQRRHAAIPATSAGRREYFITTVLDTQSFGEEAHHSLSDALELFPSFELLSCQ